MFYHAEFGRSTSECVSINRGNPKIVSLLLTLSDLERRDTMGQIIAADYRNCAYAVWPSTSKFGKVTCGKENNVIYHN